MTPEEIARKEIDHNLTESGWIVQDFNSINITAGQGVAVREYPFKSGHADYLLYANGKVIAIVEAKPEGHTLTGVEVQSEKYTTGLPDGLPCYTNPIPFAFESTGKVTQFTNNLDPHPRSREVFTFHRPEELIRLATLDAQLRGNLQHIPDLIVDRLWPPQVEAIQNLEESFSDNRPRALIQMATGSGKTYTACTFCYRLIKFAKAKRILFLVDRNNLGRQAHTEFQQYNSPYTNYKFTDEFNVQHLRKNTIDPASKVCITTIQRLYSMLKGEDEYGEEAEEDSMFESVSPLLPKEPLPVVYNQNIPIETFDFIIVDECHRSIYNIWRQVLEYFDAYIIGLTATPTAQTIGFFQGNMVQDYSHEKAVSDGVNVGYDVYRIQTQITSAGATLKKKPDYYVPHRDRRTLKKRYAELDDDLTYTANQLDRDVVSESQLRLVIQTFKEKLNTEIFPDRTEVPKTLVFAKNDLHADDIVKEIRLQYNRGNDFCQKITCKTTGKKPEDLLNEFRNSYNPRIAVTVDMIATGTDVKPLECLLFMRNVNSAAYFEQMKGRGVRIINKDDLQSVTQDAKSKTRFVIVDAIGVCEKDKTHSKPLDRKPSVPLNNLLQSVAKGMVHPDIVSTLASRLARLNREIDQTHIDQIKQESGGKSPSQLIDKLLTSIDPDNVTQKARNKFNIPADQEPEETQLQQAEQECMTEALKPFHNPKLRDTILRIKSSLEQVIDEITQDTLLSADYDQAAKEKAKSHLENFRKFIDEHKDEIEALQILYSRPYRAGIRYSQVKDLADKLNIAPFYINSKSTDGIERLWSIHEAVEPDKVKGHGSKLVDLIAMVRHAIEPDTPLVPRDVIVEQRYHNWLAEKEAEIGNSFTPEQRQWLDAIKDHIANSLQIEKDDFEYAPFNTFGGLGKADQLFGDQLPTIISELNERLAA